jgi:DNA modification methylase
MISAIAVEKPSVAWPAATVEIWPIERLTANPRNARIHGPEQIEQIRASLREFGWTMPVLVRENGMLIAGHGRLEAAKLEGITEVPTIVARGWTEAQCQAYAICDNKLTEAGEWSEELLRLELGDLREAGFDLALTGIDQDELDSLLDGLDAGRAFEDEDDVPELPVETVTRPGDLWLLGPHRLLCGDATVATDVERVLDQARPHLMVTDPPYGVEYDPSWRNESGVSATTRTGKVNNDDRADWREAWSLFPGEVAYIWHSGIHARTVAESLDACGFLIRAQIIWAKPRLVLGRGDYHWQHEPCLYAVRRQATGHWQGARDQSTVWAIGHGGDEDGATIHGTQKPVECMRRPILNNSVKGDLVYEPFAGSGTTIIAAETTNRACLAIEIDPSYCDVIVERWEQFTGGAACRETADGRAA